MPAGGPLLDPRYLPSFNDVNAGSRDKASPLFGGLGAGFHQLLGLGGSAVQGIANLEGADKVAALASDFASRQNEIAARIRPDLDVAPWQEGGAHVLPWAEYQLGKMAPMLAGFIGAGALAPETAAGTALARGLPAFLGGAGAGATPEAAAAAGRFVLGGGAFGGGLGFGQGVQSADQRPGGATAADSVQALVESPAYAAASILTPGFLKGALGKGGGNALTRIVTKGLEGSAVGAFQTGAMTGLDQTFRQDLTAKEKMNNIVDATVIGAAVAGLAGGIAGGLPGGREIKRVDPNKITTDQLDEITAQVDPTAQQNVPLLTSTVYGDASGFRTDQSLDRLNDGTNLLEYNTIANPKQGSLRHAKPYEQGAAAPFGAAPTEELLGIAKAAEEYLAGLPEDHRPTERDIKVRNQLALINAELEHRNVAETSANVQSETAGAVEPSPTDSGASGGADKVPAPAKITFNDKKAELAKGLRLPGRFLADINGAKNVNELLAKVHNAIFDQQDIRSTVQKYAQRLGLLDDQLNPTTLANTIAARKAEQAGTPVAIDPKFKPIWSDVIENITDRRVKEMRPANEADAQRLVYEALTADRAEVSDDLEKVGQRLGLLDHDKRPTSLMATLAKQDISPAETDAAAKMKGFKTQSEYDHFDAGARFVGSTKDEVTALSDQRDRRAMELMNEVNDRAVKHIEAFKNSIAPADEHIATIVKGLDPNRIYAADELQQHINDFKDELAHNAVGKSIDGLKDKWYEEALNNDPEYQRVSKALDDALTQDPVELPQIENPRDFAAFMEGRAWAQPETLSSAETRRVMKDQHLGDHFDAGHREIPDEQRAQRPLNERIDERYPPTKFPTENAQLKGLVREGDDTAALAEAERYLKSGHGALITPPAPARPRDATVRPTIHGNTIVPDTPVSRLADASNAEAHAARKEYITGVLHKKLQEALEHKDLQAGDYILLRQALNVGDHAKVREALASTRLKPYVHLNGKDIATGRDRLASADLLQRQNLLGGGARGLMQNIKELGGPLGNMAARFEKYVPEDIKVEILTPDEIKAMWESESGSTLPGGKIPVGNYDPDTRVISLSTEMSHPAVAMHEIVHSITADHITNKTAIGREMAAMYNRFKNSGPSSDYAFTDAHEFMSEFLARQQVRDYVRDAQPTVFQRVWNAIRKLFGMPSQDYVERILKLAEKAGANPVGRSELNAPLMHARLVEDQVKAVKNAVDESIRRDSVRGVVRKIVLGWASRHDIAEYWGKWFDPAELGEQFRGMVNPLKAFEAHQDQKQSIVARMAQMLTTARDTVQALPRPARETLVRLMMLSEHGIDPTKDWDSQIDAVKSSKNPALKAKHAEAHKLWNDVIVRGGHTEAYRGLRDVNDTQMLSQIAVTLHAQVAADTVAGKELSHFATGPMDRFLDAQNNEDFTPATARKWWANEVNAQMSALEDYFRMHRSVAEQITGDSKAEITEKANILNRIDPLQKRVKNIRQAVAQLDEAPYFHLGRFGNHFIGWDVVNQDALGKVADLLEENGIRGVISRASEKTNAFLRMENQEQVARVRQLLEGFGEDVIQPGSIISGERTSQVIRNSLADQWFERMIEDIKSSEDITSEAKDTAIRALQAFHLDLMPENSISRIMTHREGVPGYDPDMLRAFEHRANVGINALAGMVVAPKISRAFTDMRTLEEAAQRSPSSQVGNPQRTGMTNVIDELSRRERERPEWPQNKFLDQLKAINHAWFLGGSISYGLVNLTQLGATLLPELGARHGFAKTFGMMAKVTPDALRIIRSIAAEGYNVSAARAMDAVVTRSALDKAGISKAEAEFIMRVANSGQLDIGGPSRELMRAAEGRGDGKTDAALRVASSIGYYTETLSRLIAALSSYHLDKMATPEQAAERAVYVLKETMWDYSQANQGRKFGKRGVFGEVTPLATSFMQYTAQLSGKLYRETYEAFRGTPAERAEARRFLFQHAVSMTVLAGSLGLPMTSALAAMVDRLKDEFDDDGKPSDVRAAWRNMLSDTFGKDAGEVLARGAFRGVGVDLSTRIGEQDILPFSRFFADRRNFKDSIKDLQARSWGAPTSMIANAMQGGERIMNGDFLGGMQRMLPNALAAPLKAYQMTEKGYVDATGKVLPMSPSTANIMTQIIGFNSATNAEYTEARQDQAVRKGILTREATILRNNLVDASINQDRDAMRDALEQITKFNKANNANAITGTEIRGALERRARAQALSDVTASPLGVAPEDFDARRLTRYANIDYRQ
jgi:hypothetical protein